MSSVTIAVSLFSFVILLCFAFRSVSRKKQEKEEEMEAFGRGLELKPLNQMELDIPKIDNIEIFMMVNPEELTILDSAPVAPQEGGIPPPPPFVWEIASRPIPPPKSRVPPPPDFIMNATKKLKAKS